MKTILSYSSLSLFLLFWGCSSTSNSLTNEDSAQEEAISESKKYYNSLADFLRRTPGFTVTGSGDNVYVRMHGANSFSTGVTPLYVIDGQPVGTSYVQANSMVDAKDIDYVKVLKGPDASSYGIRGANGVIEIYTKKGL